MARGANSKAKITADILSAFPGAFVYEKEIRIPIVEDGETIQIKCVLTAAKVNVDNGGDVAIPGAEATVAAKPAPSNFMNAPTEEEKKNVQDLCERLGLLK